MFESGQVVQVVGNIKGRIGTFWIVEKHSEVVMVYSLKDGLDEVTHFYEKDLELVGIAPLVLPKRYNP